MVCIHSGKQKFDLKTRMYGVVGWDGSYDTVNKEVITEGQESCINS